MGGNTATTTQTVTIPPEVLARYNAVNARAEKVAQTPFRLYGTTADAFVAPLTQTQQAGIENVNQAAGMSNPYFGAATGLTMSGVRDVGPLSQEQIAYYQNPFTQSVVNPTLEALQQQQGMERSALMGKQAMSGAFGGDRAGLERANLARQQSLATAQAISPLYMQGYQQAVQTASGQQGVMAQDLARRMAAGQQIGGLGAAGQAAALQGAQAQLAAGQMEQQTDQAGRQALYNQFLQQQGYPFQVAQFLANIAMGTGALSGSTTTTTQPTGFFSDERLKHDAEKIGETFDGQPIYRFKYDGDDRTQIGLMAQKVERRHPEAVGLAAGFKTVDYEKATDEAADRGKFYSGGEASMGGGVMPRHAGLGFAAGGLAEEDAIPYGSDAMGGGQGILEGVLQSGSKNIGSLPKPGDPPKVRTGMDDAKDVLGLARSGASAIKGLSGLGSALGAGSAAATGAAGAGAAGAGLGATLGTIGEGIMSVAPLLLGFLSDERAKENKEQVGELYDGQPVYRYNYKGDDRTQIGLMAQNVERRHPEAVGDAGGLKFVDYRAATEGAAGREHFAVGGGAVFDPNTIQQLLTNQAGMYSGMYGQPGGPRGAQGTPGVAGRVPTPSLPVGRLATAGSAPQQQPSGLSQAASTGRNIADLLQMGSKAAPFITGGKDSSGARIPSLTERVGAAVSPMQGPGTESMGGKPLGTVASGKIDEEDANRVLAAHGGFIHRQAFKAGGLSEADLGDEPKLRDPGLGALLRGEGEEPQTPPERGLQMAKLEPTGVVSDAPKPSFERALNRVFKEEGELNPRDTNGQPSLYGINAKYHPEFFKDPSKEKAAEIYRTNYWNAINGDKLPPALAHVAMDTAVIAGPRKANELIEASGGDPQKLLALRDQFQKSLIARDPDKYGPYAGTWSRRIANLRQDVAQMGGSSGQPTASDAPDGVRTVERRGIAAPGLGGPGQGNLDPYAAPFRNTLGKMLPEGTSEALKSENFWIPALAGLGSMLASKNTTLGGAIGEGLVGGTSAYTQLQKQQSDIGLTGATTEKAFADIVNSSIVNAGGRTYIRAMGPNGYYLIPFNEWWALDPKQRPKVDPRVESIINQIAPSILEKEGGAPGASPAPTGEAAKPAPVAAVKPVAPAAPAPATPPVEAPKAAEAPKVSEPVKPQPAPTRSAGPVTLSDEDRNEALKSVKLKSGWAEDRIKQEPDYFSPQDQMAATVAEQKNIILPLAGTLASLPKQGSVFTSGKFQEVANPIVSVLNNLAAIAGKPDLIADPKQLANVDEVKKLTRQLQGIQTPAGQQAYAAFRDTLEALPTILTSPGGQAQLVAQMLTNAQRIDDKNSYFNQWSEAAGGEGARFSEWAKSTSREANRAFDKRFSNAFYAKERESLEKMFNTQIKGPDGKPMSQMAYVAKHAADLTGKQRQDIKDRYGEGILRYFGVKD